MESRPKGLLGRGPAKAGLGQASEPHWRTVTGLGAQANYISAPLGEFSLSNKYRKEASPPHSTVPWLSAAGRLS